MYIVDFSKLKEGDILLTAQNGAISKAVRAVSKSSYSHAILYVGDGSYIHSDSEGVHAGNIQRLLFDKSKHVQALRPIEVKYAKDASIYARSQIGKEYSVKDAISTKNPLSKKSESNRQFCSRLVAKSYEYAGLNLVKNSGFCTPQDICESPEVIVVAEFLKEATEEDIRFSKSENPLQRQSEITNKILESSRKLTKHDIQSFEDLGQFILDNPKYDIEITRVIENSGYLSMWEYEMNQNPWRYDGELFLSLPISIDEKRRMAAFELKSANKQLQIYSRNYTWYQSATAYGILSYIKMNMHLYKNLINQMNMRADAAKYVLEHT